MLLYTAIVTPFVIAFIVSENWDYWFWIDFLIDISFLIDTVLNLNTAYFTKDDFLIFNRKKIILNYLFGWLLLDIIASIPFGMIQALISDRYQGDLNGLIKILKIKSIPRLFRFSKLSKLIRQQKTSTYFENIQIALNIRYSIMRLFSALSVIILSLHVVACL